MQATPKPSARTKADLESARADMSAPYDAPDAPSVMGAGGGLSPLPTQRDAEVAWRAAYVARMVERGIDLADATACCAAGPATLSEEPGAEVDAELEYWDNDEPPTPEGETQ